MVVQTTMLILDCESSVWYIRFISFYKVELSYMPTASRHLQTMSLFQLVSVVTVSYKRFGILDTKLFYTYSVMKQTIFL